MPVELVPARLVHVGPIASRMREIDRIEAAAMGRTPKDALRIGLRASLSAFTAMDGAKPLAMMGVVSTSLISGRAAVWFLGRDEVYQRGKALLTLGPPVLRHWLETFTVLENVVAVQNVRAIRLLKRWGFAVGDEIEVHGGVEFVPFSLKRSGGDRRRSVIGPCATESPSADNSSRQLFSGAGKKPTSPRVRESTANKTGRRGHSSGCSIRHGESSLRRERRQTDCGGESH